MESFANDFGSVFDRGSGEELDKEELEQAAQRRKQLIECLH